MTPPWILPTGSGLVCHCSSAAASVFPPTCRMKRGELFDYLTEKVTLSEKETR